MRLSNSSELSRYGINIKWATTFGTWGESKKVITESPVQFRGGMIGIDEIGAFSYLGAGNSYFHHVERIGRFSAFGPDVIMGDSEHPTDSLTPHPMFGWKFDDWSDDLLEDKNFVQSLRLKLNGMVKKTEKIVVGNDVWIGRGAVISRGVKIGDGAIIAAKAVVTKDVSPYTIVGGVPAKPIRKRFTDDIVQKLLSLKWWEYGPGILKNVDITDIDATIYAIEERIASGIPKYEPDKIEFNIKDNVIYHISKGERTKIYL